MGRLPRPAATDAPVTDLPEERDVQVQLSTDPSTPDWPNEDFAAVAPGVAVLLDGAGTPGGKDTGCVHGVAWYARTAGGVLLARARDLSIALPDALATAIQQVADLHSDTCDLSHPSTPSATVLVARERGDVLEYLILTDSIMLFQTRGAESRILTDTRLEHTLAALRPIYSELPPGSPEREEARRRYIAQVDEHRNRPGGYWVAAADPAAAAQALTGATPLAELAAVALVSDGVGRLADRYGQVTWPEIGAILAEHGPAEVIRRLRAVEATDPAGERWPRYKIRDDATIAYWHLAAPLPQP